MVEEVYYPRPDNPCIKDFVLAVTDGAKFFSWEKENTHYQIESSDSGVPAYRLSNQCREGRYRIEKDVISDPLRPSIVQRIRFIPALDGTLQLFAILNTHLGAQGRGWIGEFRGTPMLFAQGEGISIAMANSVPWLNGSVGFMRTSDGRTDLSKHKKMKWLYDRAEDGHIVLTGQVNSTSPNENILLVLGFGTDPDSAAMNAHATLLDHFDTSLHLYISGWKQWQDTLLPLDKQIKGNGNLYRASTAVIRTHQAKMPLGAIVASLGIPFGQGRCGNDTAGYHLVWPRDLVEAAGGLLAAGDPNGAYSILTFLESTQESDGHWPQNMWLSGKPQWLGIQMDETAQTILLVDLARRKGAISENDVTRFWPMVRNAVSYLVCNGPVTPEDRWEVDGGYSTFTLGTEIAALLVAAEMAMKYEPSISPYLQETADIWNSNIERWMYVSGTKLAKKIGVDGYYARLGRPTGQATAREAKNPKGGGENTVSMDALALVRFGLRNADDNRITNTIKAIDHVLKVDLGYGPGWLRYNGDQYGEYPDGEPFDDKGGQGRAWPLFSGERGHYELAFGNHQRAEDMLRLMEATATKTGLIPEQVWDADDVPEKGLFRGKPTTSACPLVWAHAEYVKLLRSLKDGCVFDCPPQTIERYREGYERPKILMWKFNHKIQELPFGYVLRIEVIAPATIHWFEDQNKQEGELATEDTGLGLHRADLPTEHLPVGCKVKFTINWTDVTRKKSPSFQVVLRKTETTT